jgi:ATP-dependent protease ClpP protease subunit
MAAIVNENEIVLYGTVGEMMWEDSFTARDVVAALSQARGKDIAVRINSGGGIADEGVAIYNSLKAHQGKITVYVDGIAASAASIIAMAGDKVVMRTGSVMMIHDPLMLAIGNASTMEKSIEALNAIGDSMADIYSAKTGRPAADIRAEMKEELWLTPVEAKDKGYADDEEDEDAVEASAFDYRAYSRAPARIVAMSDARSWSNRLKAPRASAATIKERPLMADTTNEAAASEAEAATKAAVEAERERVAEIHDICARAGTVALASALIRDGSSVEQARARAEAEKSRITAIRQKVQAARASLGSAYDPSMADEFIASGASPEAVGNALLEKITATQQVRETRSQYATDDGMNAAARASIPAPQAIYAKRRESRARMPIAE